MRNFRSLLVDAHDQASLKKEQRQKIVLSLVLSGIFLYLVWADKIPDFPNSGTSAIMVAMLIMVVVVFVIVLLFSALPIGKVKIKDIRKNFFNLYHEELSRLKKHKSDIEKNIVILKEKQFSNPSSTKITAINDKLILEEARLDKASAVLRLFRQKVEPYVRPTEVNSDITSYIR